MMNISIENNKPEIRLNSQKLSENLAKRAEHDINSGKIAGCGLCVHQGGKEIFSGFFGYSDAEEKTPIQPNTIYRLASMTKPVTAASALLLRETGKLNINDKLSKYCPKFSKLKIGELDANRNIINLHTPDRELTLLDLLTHTAGFGTDEIGTMVTDKTPQDAKKNLETIMQYYCEEMILTFEPNSRRSYSPIAAFDAIAYVIELISEREIGEYMKEKIFAPLNMTDTTFELTPQQTARLSAVYDLKDGIVPVSKKFTGSFEGFPLSYHAGGAGLFSTVGDYCSFAQALCSASSSSINTFISSSSVSLMRKGREIFADIKNHPAEIFGLGVRVVKNNPNIPSGCFGWSGAYGTHFWIDPVNEITAVYMKSSNFDGGAGCTTANNFEYDIMHSVE